MKNKIKLIAMIILIIIIVVFIAILLKVNRNKGLQEDTLKNYEYETEILKEITTEITTETSTEIMTETETEGTTIIVENEEILLNYLSKFKDNSPNSDKALTAYKDFLENKIRVQFSTESDGDNCQDLYEQRDKRYDKDLKYALLDVNNDNFPELLVHSIGRYDIYTYRDDKLVLWHEMHYYYDRLLENKNFRYTREGGAPNHMNYMYKIFNKKGDIEYLMDFSVYDADENGVYDENDAYFIKDTQMSKAEWDKKTKDILAMKEYKIDWQKMDYADGIIKFE